MNAGVGFRLNVEFQCSSASRKFLNRPVRPSPAARAARFSALQRAENSSIITLCPELENLYLVSVLFSEPKIPQYRALLVCSATARVSVLFSEPKIPQFSQRRRRGSRQRGFSALQRAENSSIVREHRQRPRGRGSFSALQRAENSSIVAQHLAALRAERVSVLFSEPKIPQW